jgi:uncharacterized protein with ATP-grasp and redox domains
MRASPFIQGRLLKPFPQCRQCLEDLTTTAAEFAAGGDPELLRRAQQAARAAMAQSAGSLLSSPEVANRILRGIRRETGVHDPYRNFKAQEQATGRQAAARAQKMIGEDLTSLVKLAALGNSLDFFKPPQEAMAEVERVLAAGVDMQHDDIPRLERFLTTRRGTALYLTDNAGEIFFDLPLYRHLSRHFERVFLVVKGGPALNDLTRPDLQASGLMPMFPYLADTGVDGAGVEWDLASEEFKDLVARADLMVVKGMANFETLCPLRLPSPRFHIFRVKCRPMRDYLLADPESFWALWREAGESCQAQKS